MRAPFQYFSALPGEPCRWRVAPGPRPPGPSLTALLPSETSSRILSGLRGWKQIYEAHRRQVSSPFLYPKFKSNLHREMRGKEWCKTGSFASNRRTAFVQESSRCILLKCSAVKGYSCSAEARNYVSPLSKARRRVVCQILTHHCYFSRTHQNERHVDVVF